jgi:hypothetical protein
VAAVVQPGQGIPAGQLCQVRLEQLDGLDLPDQLGMRGGKTPGLVVGLGHVARDEHGSQAPVVPVDEQGGAYLVLGATAGELHHDLGLLGSGGSDTFAEQLLG